MPELFRKTGGVQVFSRRLVAALDHIFNLPVPIVSRNDRPEDLPSDFARHRSLCLSGRLRPQLRRFGVLNACLRFRSCCILSTHPDFTRWLHFQKRLFNTRYLTVAHGIDVWNLRERRLINGLKSAECVLAVSRFTRERLIQQLGNDAPPIEVFHNTFDAARFHPGAPQIDWRARLIIPKKSKVLLSVTRVERTEEAKGYDRVLDALPSLRRTYPECVWVLAGKGNDLERVQQRAADLGVQQACRFPGFVEDAELPDLYRSANVFVLPSRKEGFGIVFLEAAACGLRVIAGNADGSVDALADGALGMLIDPFDNETLVNAVQQALSEPPPDSAKLHAECVRRFGWDAFVDRTRDVLERYGLFRVA